MATYPEIFIWLAFLAEELKFRTRILRTDGRTDARTHRQREVSTNGTSFWATDKTENF